MVGRQAVDRCFDPVQLADAVKRLLGDRRADGSVYIEELTPDVSPTAGFGDTIAGKQLVESGIAIGMDHAGEPLQVRPRVLALAIGRVEEQCRRRPVSGKSPLVANVGPQSS